MWRQEVSFDVALGQHAVEIRNSPSTTLDFDAVRIESTSGAPTAVPTTPSAPTTVPTTNPTSGPTTAPTTAPTKTPTPAPTSGSGNGFGAGTYQENHSLITYAGTWSNETNASASGGSLKYTNQQGAKASFQFNGTKLTIIRSLSPNYGSMQVCIDGSCQTVSNYNASVMWQQPVSFTVAAGTHSVEIRNPSTTYFDLDAIRVESSSPTTVPPTATSGSSNALGAGTYQENHAKLTYSGVWTSEGNASASGGSLKYTNQDGAKVTFQFTGTRLTIIRALSPGYGNMVVCVDGSCQTVSNYNASVMWQQPVSFTVAAGTHTVEIRNPSTTYFDLDAIRID
jgi:hypothetical protein